MKQQLKETSISNDSLEEHTPLPWAYSERAEVSGIPSTESHIPFSIYYPIPNASAVEPIADIVNFPPSNEFHVKRQRANARLIVQAVNNYNALKEINKILVQKLEQILIHSSEENEDIARQDKRFGADELQAIRIKAKQARQKAKQL